MTEAANLSAERLYAGKTDDKKLVPAKSAGKLRVVECRPQMSGDSYQRGIAGIVAEVVINGLETVDIDQHDRKMLPAEACRQHFERTTIGQARKLVQRRLAANFFNRQRIAEHRCYGR